MCVINLLFRTLFSIDSVDVAIALAMAVLRGGYRMWSLSVLAKARRDAELATEFPAIFVMAMW